MIAAPQEPGRRATAPTVAGWREWALTRAAQNVGIPAPDHRTAARRGRLSIVVFPLAGGGLARFADRPASPGSQPSTSQMTSRSSAGW